MLLDVIELVIFCIILIRAYDQYINVEDYEEAKYDVAKYQVLFDLPTLSRHLTPFLLLHVILRC